MFQIKASFFKGCGYKTKLLGTLEAMPAYLYYKLIFSRVKYNVNLAKKNISFKTGQWFLEKHTKDTLDVFLSWPHEQENTSGQRCLRREFYVLGINAKYERVAIDWHKDLISAYRWKKGYYKKLYPVFNLHDDTDGKLPYEISRFQHILSLIKGFLFTKDEAYPREVINQIRDWIDENPFPYGINWTCAMEVSIRACNWIWAWWAFRDNLIWTDEFNRKFLISMWQHGWYIEHNLEDKGDMRTNHYLANIVGLLFIGIMFPQFKDAKRWKEFGIKDLNRCMEEMVYPDGVSFENSIAYHRLVLEFFTYSAILCQKNGIELPDSFWQRLEKMFEFIMHCTRPDGRMPMIGDSDDGRFFIVANYYDWDRWDQRYLLSIGAVLFEREDFKEMAGRFFDEAFWILGKASYVRFSQLGQKTTLDRVELQKPP
jgi:hypothetical protein